jgi:hypothetical protein
VTDSHVTIGPPPEFAGGLTAGQLGRSRIIGPNQQLITGSAAQVAALEFFGVDVSGTDAVRAEMQVQGGQVNLFGTFVVADDAFFRMGSGTLNSLISHVGGAAGSTTTGGTAVQSGGIHTADFRPIAGVPELLATGLTAFLLALNPGDVGTYSLSGTGVFNAIGGATLGGRVAGDETVHPGGVGTLNVSGGTMNITDGRLLVIAGTGSRINLSGGRISTESIDLDGDFAALNWTGGTLAITGAGPFDIGSGGPIGMSLSMTPGKTLDVTNALRATSGGAIVLAGGVVRSDALDLGGDPSRLHWSSGKLAITGSGGIDIGPGEAIGASINVPAGGTLETSAMNVVAGGAVFVAPGGRAVVTGALANGGDVRLAGGNARIESAGSPIAEVVNARLLRGDGQIDLSLSNSPGGEVRVTGGETLRFTGALNSNEGRINLVSGGAIEFTSGLGNGVPGQITGRGTLIVGAGGLLNVGTVTFTGAGDSAVYGDITQFAGARLITTGNSTVTYFDDIAGPATSEIRVSSGSTAVFMGSATGNFTGGGTKIFDGPAAPAAPASAGVIASVAGDTVVESSVLATRVREDELEVNGLLTIALSGAAAAGTSRVNALAIGAGGQLDLKDNKLIVAGGDVGAFDGVAYGGLTGQIARGYNFSAWDGDGLVTTMPAAGSSSGVTTIAIATADEVFYAGGTFGGVPVASGDVLVMYTYAGDLNLDGIIDGADYGTIDNWVQFPGTAGYANGDVNYDGIIDGADYGIIDNAVQFQGAPFPSGTYPAAAMSSAITAVPEPSAACGFAIVSAAVAAMSPRRRRRA